ncbi:MAG: DEAD/DEAH box helicase [Erysipelotrichaceae bacterium]|uniref:DEAD/DEAH box helicase n=2 Tax=Floccifex sp. TaxID=2815810 RepID=UPI002A75ED1A|nr:DEAD/DEAH box helicase [Floccifex sp.]MDD7280621.1 DEAD/DEAH box helicase [Erysipelotrichaceae bacterium]MDY2957720.1 DEAD/DEAH box helicase [Floccifex sp.]
MESFTEYKYIDLEINEVLKRGILAMGYEKLTPIQAKAIPLILDGIDITGQAQTGTGKTAAFGIPMLEKIDAENKNVQALILAPTRELAMQIAEELRNYSKYMQGIRILPIYGGQSIDQQIKALKGAQIVVGTPGRVIDHLKRRTLKCKQIQMVVLDEADEMLNMGFREDIEVILNAIDHPHQTCLFSATMPKPILDISKNYQNYPEFIKVTSSQLTIANVTQYYYAIKKEYKYEALKRLLRHYRYSRCVIFCNTKTMVDELSDKLQRDGFNANGLHGDLNQKQRDFVMSQFRNNEIDLFICTDIAARGIDVDNVEAVINYDVPSEIEYYVHRIGRTGRAGKEGVSHTLCTSKEFRRLRQIENLCHVKMIEKEIPSAEEIKKNHQKEVLNKILETCENEKIDENISVVYKYCKTHRLSIEEFALASFKLLLGNDEQELDIDLPKQEKKKKKKHKK